jgi:polyphenol oxidase
VTVPVLRFGCFADLPVDVAVTTRAGGVSEGPYASLDLSLHVGDDDAAVVENRRRAAVAAGAGVDDLVFSQQTHSANVAVVVDADRGRGSRSLDDAIGETDALVTTEPGPVLVTMVADCVPIVLYDPEAHVLATVHAGWGGTVQRIVARAVEAMTGVGAEPHRLVAGIGPAIGGDDYQVGADVQERVVEGLPPLAEQVLRTDPSTPDRWLLDLPLANRLVLVEAGVPDGQIETMACSTLTDDRFFSHRRQHPTGRFALLARLS